MNGIDVSYHQGVIDWETVRHQIDFSIIRVGYGNGNIDKQAIRNMSECTRLNIPFGVYWFSYAYSKEMAGREANQCLTALGNFKPTYPIIFDWEYDSDKYAKLNGVTVNKKLLGDMCDGFCDVIEDANWYAMVYTNEDYLINRFPSNVFKKYDMWYARYININPRKVNLWQRSSKGNIQGIKNHVDLNTAYIDYPSIILRKNLQGR